MKYLVEIIHSQQNNASYYLHKIKVVTLTLTTQLKLCEKTNTLRNHVYIHRCICFYLQILYITDKQKRNGEFHIIVLMYCYTSFYIIKNK